MAAASEPTMDVNAIRKAHLRRLIAECGTVAAFAERIGTNADYLSSILADSATRNPGDQLMRRTEAAFNLPSGSLDFPADKSMAAAMAIDALPPNEQQQVFDFIRYKIDTTSAPLAREHAASYFRMIDNLKRDMRQRKTTGKPDKKG